MTPRVAPVLMDIEDLIEAGCSPAEAVDYLMTVEGDYTQEEWAEIRGCGQQAISYNVTNARDKLR